MSDKTILEKRIITCVENSISSAIVNELCGYYKPLSKLTNIVIEENSSMLKEIIDDAMKEFLASNSFREAIRSELNTRLAKIIISNASGEIERKVNELKRDPVTRAKITLAMDTLVKDLLSNTSN